MNRERLEALRDMLLDPSQRPERHGEPVDFDMSDWARRKTNDTLVCGTAACVAGWACFLFETRPFYYYPPDDVWLTPTPEGVLEAYDFEVQGAALLDLDEWTADYLFTPLGLDLDLVTREDAAKAIDVILGGGNLDSEWSGVSLSSEEVRNYEMA